MILMIMAEVMLRQIPNEYKDKKEYVDKNAGNISILCLGDSHSFYNINPKYLSMPSFNAANSSQTLDYDWMIFNHYKDKLQKLRFILIPISYSSLYEKLAAGIESWRVKNYTLYFGLQPAFNPRYYSELLNSSTKINIQKIIDYYCFGKYQHNTTTLGFATDYSGISGNTLEYSSVIASKRNLKSSTQFLNENIAYLEAIIAGAHQKNVKVILFTSPVYSGYFNKMDKTQLEETRDIAIMMTKKYSNVVYKDYLRDGYFTDADFYDADHLNGMGSEKFTKRLDSVISSTVSVTN